MPLTAYFLAVVLPVGAAPTGTAPQAALLDGASIGSPRTWPSAAGDTWFNTWGEDGDVYATSDDSPGFAGTCRAGNITVNELTGSSPARLTSPFVNCMTSYGAANSQQGGIYHDGRTWKTIGVISVGGTLYLAVARQDDGKGGYPAGLQPSDDASIIKSADDGRTWTNSFGASGDPGGAAPPPHAGTGAEAMFPGRSFGTPAFIQYGKDDNPRSAADGGARYVYALSNDGFAYDGSSYILGRVSRSRIGALNAADWQFYTGPPGGNGTDPAEWSGRASHARPILTATHQLSQASVAYIPALHTYILASSYFPFVADWPAGGAAHRTMWAFYQAPHPWGPWTRFYAGSSPLGFYDPAFVSKFITMGGLRLVALAAADFGRPSLYRLHAFPVRLEAALSGRRATKSGLVPAALPARAQRLHAAGGHGGPAMAR
jgi:hypothetical protein